MAGLGPAMMAVSVMTFLSFLIAFLGFWRHRCRPGEDRKGRPHDAKGVQPPPAIQGFLSGEERGHVARQNAKKGLEVGDVRRDSETASRAG